MEGIEFLFGGLDESEDGGGRDALGFRTAAWQIARRRVGQDAADDGGGCKQRGCELENPLHDVGQDTGMGPSRPGQGSAATRNSPGARRSLETCRKPGRMQSIMKNASPEVDAYISSAAKFAQPILKKVRAAFHKGCPDLEERFFFESHW